MLQDKKFYSSLRSYLKNFKNIDDILTFCNNLPKKIQGSSLNSNEQIKQTELKIERLIQMKNMIKSIVSFINFLKEANHPISTDIFQVYKSFIYFN
jgi:hypothetical protein